MPDIEAGSKTDRGLKLSAANLNFCVLIQTKLGVESLKIKYLTKYKFICIIDSYFDIFTH